MGPAHILWGVKDAYPSLLRIPSGRARLRVVLVERDFGGVDCLALGRSLKNRRLCCASCAGRDHGGVASCLAQGEGAASD